MPDESALPAPSHEPTDVSPRVIWIGAPVLLAAVVALALLVLGLFPVKTTDRTIHLPLQHFPSPELQVSPREDMAQFRAEQLRWLNGTGWIDKARGIAHIPIEEAMRQVAAAGIEGWPTAPPPAHSQVTPSPPVPSPAMRSQVTPSPPVPSPAMRSQVTPLPPAPSPATRSPVRPSPPAPSSLTPSPLTPSPQAAAPTTPPASGSQP